ncbi:aldose 1-epimerase family protein [Jiangella asiatica]|uniref:Aldose epimerase n=1 Tax=Jiangella asiatica TaxID=2530372 RepID=A0A4R5DTV9_9ACTN|nr:aldose 1-epimerase family protein [Jiangella asiatica]TDE15874.1 aldose epimerase [Jiangella asiatica]
MATGPQPLSGGAGREFRIASAGYRAVVTRTGATLRELTYDDSPLVDGFGAGELPPAGHGQILAPWPNRLRDGRWSWRGQQHRLPVDEPARGHSASHGLVRWLAWQPRAHDASSITLSCELPARPGYPFALDLECRYALSEDGLSARLVTRNAGTAAAPVALGAHPYLRPLGPLDQSVLTVPATRRVLTDAAGRPSGVGDLSRHGPDLRHGRPLDGLILNHTLGGLRRTDGRVSCMLAEPARTIELWAGPSCRWLQIYTGDALPGPARRRAVAVEPMTAPPQALATGTDLEVLEPGAELDLEWGLRITPASRIPAAPVVP